MKLILAIEKKVRTRKTRKTEGQYDYCIIKNTNGKETDRKNPGIE
jgi:hypothetical protein